jgi:hypothetical protein
MSANAAHDQRWQMTMIKVPKQGLHEGVSEERKPVSAFFD